MGLGLTLLILLVLLALLFWVASPRSYSRRDPEASPHGDSGYFGAYGSTYPSSKDLRASGGD